MGQGRDGTQIQVYALVTTPYCLGERLFLEGLSSHWHNGCEHLQPWVGAGRAGDNGLLSGGRWSVVVMGMDSVADDLGT